MTVSKILSVITFILIITSCIKEKEEITHNYLKEYISKTAELRFLLDTSKYNRELWDTIYLKKQNLHVYAYRGDKVDGIGLFFLVEDSSKTFFTFRWKDDNGMGINFKQALQMLSDTIYQSEPLEYQLQEFEVYLNNSYYYSNRPIDFEVLDTMVKILKLDVQILKDSNDINNAIKIAPDFLYEKPYQKEHDVKLREALKRVVNNNNNRIYFLKIGGLVLYVDYDPFYSGNLQPIIIGEDTIKENKNKKTIIKQNFLSRPINVRFITIR